MKDSPFRLALGRVTTAIASLAAAGALALVPAAAAHSAPGAGEPPLYVARGDSSSAGFGLIPYSDAARDPDDTANVTAGPGDTIAPKKLAHTGAQWQDRFAMLASAGLTLLLGIAAIIARLDIRSRRSVRG